MEENVFVSQAAQADNKQVVPGAAPSTSILYICHGWGKQSKHRFSTCAEAIDENLVAGWPGAHLAEKGAAGGSPVWAGRYPARTKSRKERCGQSRVGPCNLARDLRLPHLHLKAIMEM